MANIRKTKFTGKDTIFRDMFSKKKYLLQLYQTLHPEDNAIQENDLKIVTLKSILLNGIYNDLGFLVRENKLLILVEAQSTWSPNVVIRALMYLMSTYQDYFNENKIQLYGNVKAVLPKPELYVIYTDKKGSHPDVLSLKDEFFPNVDCCIDAKVKVIYLRDTDDIINQYIGFCRIFNEQVRLHGRTLTAAREIIRICRDNNLLKEYLHDREVEVEGIMLMLFDQEKVWDIEREHIFAQAREEGLNEGRSLGLSEGRSLGLSEGRSLGLSEGRSLGLAQGSEKEKILNIKAMMKNLKFSAEQAMAALDIPAKDFSKYLTLL